MKVLARTDQQPGDSAPLLIEAGEQVTAALICMGGLHWPPQPISMGAQAASPSVLVPVFQAQG